MSAAFFVYTAERQRLHPAVKDKKLPLQNNIRAYERTF